MEWKLPSEEQAYERLPWTRGRCFNILVSTVIFLNTAPWQTTSLRDVVRCGWALRQTLERPKCRDVFIRKDIEKQYKNNIAAFPKSRKTT